MRARERQLGQRSLTVFSPGFRPNVSMNAPSSVSAA